MIMEYPELLDDAPDLELKALKLDAIELVAPFILISKEYINYLSMYEEELKALVGLPKEEQRKGVKAIAQQVIVLYKRDTSGG